MGCPSLSNLKELLAPEAFSSRHDPMDPEDETQGARSSKTSFEEWVMRIVEALEGKGYRVPLVKAEVELAEKLATLARQLKGSGAELARRVHNLLSVSRVIANVGGVGTSFYLPGSTKTQEQSLADMQEVLQQQTEAIARLGNVLKSNMRDMEIIMSEDTEMLENGD